MKIQSLSLALISGSNYECSTRPSSLYIFHLRGNQRTSGERSRKEGGKVFGSGSRAPIAISVLVKNPESKQMGQIKFHDIGDYLSTEQKLEIVQNFKDINGISKLNAWEAIIPNEFNDWVNQRDPNFNSYISLGNKKSKDLSLFETYSMGIKTNRDAWVYNSSNKKLQKQVQNQIDFYNHQVNILSKLPEDDRKDALDLSLNKFKWTSDLLTKVVRGSELEFQHSSIVKTERRPFSKEYLYCNKDLNWTLHLIKQIYPTSSAKNEMIYLVGTGTTKPFSTLMIDKTPDFQLLSNGQGFPLYLYEEIENNAEKNNPQLSLTSSTETSDENVIKDDNGKPIYRRKDAITDEGLAHFTDYYGSQMKADISITKEDLFYYIYGLLHSEDYRERYAENLTKQLPNIPRVQKYDEFVAFSTAGRQLADLHINYENVDMYQGVKLASKLTNLKLADGQNWAKSKIEDDKFYVTKMKHPKRKNEETGKNEDDPTKIVYNSHITIEHIPEDAYDYVVNGKPAIEWIIERQGVKTDKKSGITNDANDWAIETMKNPRYPLELLLRVINVSLKTQAIVRKLPKLVLEKVGG
ncbi:type ISP restriction/modification enzyme [Psychrobacter sp. H7-1]|uniref:type ISP restriction/modification enzyme n=1 Tax=Psychrobacter sp. H7-1 TaxID=1569265 RepID=UPI00191AF377|nr:type ISP restriction/modification enzyme [Psychrobacter sp. H7-1]